MIVTKTWPEIQTKIRHNQALQDLTVLELLIAMDVADKVIALNKWQISIDISQDAITVILPKECEPQSFTDELRDRVIEELVDYGKSGSFGDGLEEDYLRDGTEFVGFNNLSDSELLEELEMYSDEENELVQECKLQLETTKMLKD